MSSVWVEVTEVESSAGHGSVHTWRVTVERSWKPTDSFPPSPYDIPVDIKQALLNWLAIGTQ